jgi:hypothetical protein
VFCPRKPKVRHHVRPILKQRGAKCILVHVGADFCTPSGRKAVELSVSLLRVAVCISLQIGQTDVSDHIDVFQLREMLEKIKRQRSQIMRIEKR